jgi:vacuolar-type H+-ATPase subunit E/Vma4
MELILYQLGELKNAVESGFSRLELRHDRLEARVAALEAFRERTGERERVALENSNDTQANLVKAVLAALTIIATILYLVANHGVT